MRPLQRDTVGLRRRGARKGWEGVQPCPRPGSAVTAWDAHHPAAALCPPQPPTAQGPQLTLFHLLLSSLGRIHMSPVQGVSRTPIRQNQHEFLRDPQRGIRKLVPLQQKPGRPFLRKAQRLAGKRCGWGSEVCAADSSSFPVTGRTLERGSKWLPFTQNQFPQHRSGTRVRHSPRA